MEALRAHKLDVLCLGRDKAKLQSVSGPHVQVCETDYSESNLNTNLAGVDAVVHLAGRRTLREDDPRKLSVFVDANLETLENLFAAAEHCGVRKFVFSSTIAVYSAQNNVPFQEQEYPQPLNPYGLSKLLGEQCLQLWSRNSRITTTSLRIAAVYGYGERTSGVLMKFVDRAMAGKPLELTGNTAFRIDQIYVRDVARAIVASLTECSKGGVINIGAGRTYSISDIADAVNEAFENTGNIANLGQVDGDFRDTHMNIQQAALQLGWRPTWGLRQGLCDLKRTADLDTACSTW